MLEWDDLRFVLAVARAGSLVGAGSALRVDATTAGRRIDHVEATLGMPLFVRQRGAWRLTTAGTRVVVAGEEAERAVLRAVEATRDLEATPRGRVHLTTVEAVSTWLVAPLLPAMHARWPRIEVVILSTLKVLDLAKGEADLAIRVGNPTEPGLVSRRLGAFSEFPYTSRTWLESQGLAAGRITHLEGAPIVVMPGSGHRSDLARVGGGPVALRTGSTSTLLEAVACGLGVGILPSRFADRDPRLVRLDGLDLRRDRNLWLVFREEVGRSPAVRAVADALVTGLSRA